MKRGECILYCLFTLPFSLVISTTLYKGPKAIFIIAANLSCILQEPANTSFAHIGTIDINSVNLKRAIMSKPLQLPVCTSCSRPIMPNDECVKYYCPNCGYVLMWRCESCREFARPYKCVGCGFEGP
jgi:predicted RNA-binding Zn-ribbon protein involved in translation (DUF1610 family)